MHIFRKQSAIRLFDRRPHHSSFPAGIGTAVPRNFNRGRPLGRRAIAPLCKQARTAARFRQVSRTVYLIAILMLSIDSFSFVASAGISTSSGSATASRAWASYIAEASRRFGVPAHWIRAVMQLESAGDKTTISRNGAMGLMQIMPETYAELRLRYHLGSDPYEPRDNILAGAAYLREMRDRYGPAGLLAAYNAGPGRYEEYLTRGRPLPKETHHYVGMLASMIGVPNLRRHPGNALLTSPLSSFVAAHNNGAQSTALSKTRFSSMVTPFENRPDTPRMLFAIHHATFEPPSTSTHTVDMTALEPSSYHVLSAISASGERLSARTSKAAQWSLEPSDNALFVGRSAHAGK